MRSRIGVGLAMAFLTSLLIPNAKASCGALERRVSPGKQVLAMPHLGLPIPADPVDNDVEPQIPGLWKTVFVSGGVVQNVGFDTFHRDGTELALDGSFPPATGNVCPGVWEKIGPRTYTTVHPAFNYDPAGINIVSVFIEPIHVTVSQDGNSFSGTFSWDSYDFQGKLLPGSVAGTITGSRIAVGRAFPFPFPL